ncbi:Ribonuclease H-like protein [Glarea lozoyensis ATCC 20868]|uniref:Ribonuclease H-like protein n=1 Tax=Glarea lozoyensis (strain ATCC 20868 / MF5171) TaxID=1116229 RepID=S3CV06_GLAL2|nr:Ribonuclease H-like protein [Glarea lozoyensis ATCC 20868]EPE28784.1 Ribonuclease H-like protein [Glarea lozoyensis ATCC 20868]
MISQRKLLRKSLRKARRAHERDQKDLQKLGLRLCTGCDYCTETQALSTRKPKTASETPRRHPRPPELLPRSTSRHNLENRVFEATVTINPRDVALSEAKKETELRAEPGRLVYWTDASYKHLTHTGGIGICHFPSASPWIPSFWRVNLTRKSHVFETYAIAKELELALHQYQEREIKDAPAIVYVYSDCVTALEYFAQFRRSLSELSRLPYGKELVGSGIIAANHLIASNVEVELRYVPGHAVIDGNMKAHWAAWKGAG